MRIFYTIFLLFIFLLIVFSFSTKKFYAEIIQLADNSIVSTNNVSDAGANIKLVFSKSLTSNNDISCVLSVKISDERGSWLFDETKYCKLYLNLENSTEKFYLKTEDTKDWIDEDEVFCSETVINITDKVIKSIFLADNNLLNLDLFSKFYKRRIILSPKISNKIIDEWYYVYNDIKRDSKNTNEKKVTTKPKTEPELGAERMVENQKTKPASKNKEKDLLTQKKTKLYSEKGVALTNSSKNRISKEHKVSSIVTLQYNKKVNVYKESNLNRVAFTVPSGTKAKIIDAIINTGKSTNPNLYKIKVSRNDETNIGWVSALVIYD